MGLSFSYRDIKRRLTDDGWYLDRQVGSHQKWKHPTKKGYVTVIEGETDFNIKTLRSMFDQAGWPWPPR